MYWPSEGTLHWQILTVFGIKNVYIILVNRVNNMGAIENIVPWVGNKYIYIYVL